MNGVHVAFKLFDDEGGILGREEFMEIFYNFCSKHKIYIKEEFSSQINWTGKQITDIKTM